jgi:hypothetical protein
MIGGIAIVGEEYNIAEHWAGDQEMAPNAPVMSEGAPINANTTSAADDGVGGGSGGTIAYNETLSLEWGDPREWCGLALCLLTIVTATLLTTVASILQRQQQNMYFCWGGALTEQGVGELLQVGWRYQHHHLEDEQSNHNHDHNNVTSQQQQQQQKQQAPQFFLQVFDKSLVGYNDDNSILQGGVTAAMAPTNTTTATTHPTSRSHRSSTVFTATTPPDPMVEDD